VINYRNVLDYGKVSLIDYMGDDYRILESARISTGAEPIKSDDKDRGLIRYLYKNQHLTPFEQAVLTWRIKCPIFIARQWHRHRTQSINEISGRYTKLPQESYTPKMFHKQSQTNHQGAGDPIIMTNEISYLYRTPITTSYSSYNLMLDPAFNSLNIPISLN
jgi:thymidylate synthase (FAD)